MKAIANASKAAPTKRLADNETFLCLYAAALSGAASQLEQTYSDPDSHFQGGDAFATDDANLQRRERYIARRCFGLAVLALEEMEIAEVNKRL